MTIDAVLANTGTGTALPNNGTIEAEENILSYFGRINYTMADKYLATFTLRADGSSKFGKGNRWGLVPVCSIGMAYLRGKLHEIHTEVALQLETPFELRYGRKQPHSVRLNSTAVFCS